MKNLSQKLILSGVRKDLERVATPKMKAGQERFFKEEVNFIGCRLPDVRTVARKYRKMLKDDGWTYDDLLRLAEELLKKDSFEERTVAFSMVASMKKDFRKSDFRIFERWLNKYVTNWAHTDDLAPRIIAEMVGRWTELQKDVFKWTKSRNRWVRRAAAVTYVPHGRRGRYHKQIFKTANAMLGDPDDMVQKGVGWMLKEASNFDEKAVVKYLLPRTKKTSRLVLRYATEKVSKKNRKLVLSK